jgi:hypothetical protein
MPHEGQDEVEDSHPQVEGAELYGDSNIATFDARVPKFLKFTYLFWPIWGAISFYFFWNGSLGWSDRGYWRELQIAANTTFPIENQNRQMQNQPLEKSEKEGIQSGYFHNSSSR